MQQALLKWWRLNGRLGQALKPWMFDDSGNWPRKGQFVDVYQCWIAEVLVHACWGDPSSYRALRGGFVGWLRRSATNWSLLKAVGSLLESAGIDELFLSAPR